MVSGRKNSYKLEKAAVIENYLGFESISGSDLADVFFRHAQNKGVEFFDGGLVGIYDMGEYWSALASDQQVYQAKTVVLATGSVQKAAIDGEERLLGMGVSYCCLLYTSQVSRLSNLRQVLSSFSSPGQCTGW